MHLVADDGYKKKRGIHPMTTVCPLLSETSAVYKRSKSGGEDAAGKKKLSSKTWSLQHFQFTADTLKLVLIYYTCLV